MNEPDQEKIRTDTKAGVVSTLPQSLSDRYRRKLGELIELTPDQEKRIKKALKKAIDDWKADTADLHKRLVEDNDLVEGVVYDTDYPWEGASNAHVDVTGTYMSIYRSVFKRSITGANIIWYAEVDDDSLREFVPAIEDNINYKARNEWNIQECLEGVFWTTSRDGLGIIKATWCEEYEKRNDIVLISNELEFSQEFPSAEEAGLSQEEYNQILTTVKTEASIETPVEIPITVDKQVYCGVKGDVVELIDYVKIPFWVPSNKDPRCRGYGNRYPTNREVIRKKAKDGVFYEKAVNDLLKKKGKAASNSDYYTSTDWIQGIKRTNTDDEYELFELVVKGWLDGKDGEEGKYLVTYSHEHDILVQCIDYPYFVDNMAEFRIDSRPNRSLGKSIPVMTRDTNEEIDNQHNQRINARDVYTIPTFKAHTDLKQDPSFDPDLKENKFKPGRIFWSSKPELFDQFKIQPTDMGESLAEEANAMKMLDLRLGSAAALLSGGVSPQDPNAPGNKTAIMIQQSNLRMDDPLSELRKGVSELGDICVSLEYQFGSPQIKYQVSQTTATGQQQSMASFPKKILRNGIRMKMHGITVMQNPEAEMSKLMQLFSFLANIPEFAQNPQARTALIRDALRAGRINNRDKYMPTLEQVQAQQVETQKQAMMQMQQEQQMQAEAQKQEMIDQNLNAASKELRIKSVAQKMAENAMGAMPEPGNGQQPVGVMP